MEKIKRCRFCGKEIKGTMAEVNKDHADCRLKALEEGFKKALIRVVKNLEV